jgi:hypothetical protein
MRQMLAKILAVLTGVMIIAVALVFAIVQNS